MRRFDVRNKRKKDKTRLVDVCCGARGISCQHVIVHMNGGRGRATDGGRGGGNVAGRGCMMNVCGSRCA
ncbi:MAG: hypothetical protein N2595_05485 [bacterium]|nr:hypothetical protein [bacterium]